MGLLFVVSLLLGFAVSAYTLFDAQGGWQQRQKLQQGLHITQQENRARLEQVQHLQAQIKALRELPEVQEHLIRDQLGYAGPNDIIIDFAAK